MCDGEYNLDTKYVDSFSEDGDKTGWTGIIYERPPITDTAQKNKLSKYLKCIKNKLTNRKSSKKQ